MSGPSTTYHYPRDVSRQVLARIEAAVASRMPPPDVGSEILRSAGFLVPLPDQQTLASLLDSAFFGTLEQEEARAVEATLAYAPSDQQHGYEGQPFGRPVPLDARSLRKIALATDPDRTHFLVDRGDSGLIVWGVHHAGSGVLTPETRTAPDYLLVRLVRAGVVSVEVAGSRVALLTRGSLVLYDPDSLGDPLPLRKLISEILEFDEPFSPRSAVLLNIADRVVALAHGGALLVPQRDLGASTPGIRSDSGTTFAPASRILRHALDGWLETCGIPGSLGVRAEQAQCMSVLHCPAAQKYTAWRTLEEAIEHVAQLTAVDGAVVIDPELAVHRFGAVIDADPPREIQQIRPPDWQAVVELQLEQLGGNRHQSAARWCAAQPDGGVALVASQDGVLSFLATSQDHGVLVVRPVQIRSRGPAV